MGVADRRANLLFSMQCVCGGGLYVVAVGTLSTPHFGYADELVGVVRDVQLDSHIDGVWPIEEDAHCVHCTSGRGLLEAVGNSSTVNGTVI